MAGKNKKEKAVKKSSLVSEVVKEFSHITWPKGKEFKNTSFVVLIFVAIYIVYIGFLDLVLKRGFDLLFK